MILKILKILLVLAIAIGMLDACASRSTQRSYTQDYLMAKQNFVSKNYPLAFRQIQAPANAGNPDAQYALGYMYYYGKGTIANQNAAIYWFQQAAKQGQPAAQKALEMINGGVSKN